MSPQPRWRWWLFCVSLEAHWRFDWEWTLSLMGWCVLPEWLGEHDTAIGEEVSF